MTRKIAEPRIANAFLILSLFERAARPDATGTPRKAETPLGSASLTA
jgi:hypothetical protein